MRHLCSKMCKVFSCFSLPSFSQDVFSFEKHFICHVSYCYSVIVGVSWLFSHTVIQCYCRCFSAVLCVSWWFSVVLGDQVHRCCLQFVNLVLQLLLDLPVLFLERNCESPACVAQMRKPTPIYACCQHGQATSCCRHNRSLSTRLSVCNFLLSAGWCHRVIEL